MKQILLHYLSPSKFVLALAFMQIASLSSLHAMEPTEEDFDHGHDRALRAIIEKHFTQADFIEQDSVVPIYDVVKSSSEPSIMDREDLQKSFVLTPTPRDYLYYPRSLFEMIVNIMPNTSWWAEQPTANVLHTNALILLPFGRHKEESYTRKKIYNSGGSIDENLR